MAETDNTQNASLLRRAFLFLEDGEWERADEYAEKVLDGEPENSGAYLCKLMSEFRVGRKELLSDVQVEISQSKNYVNALKYADAKEKEFLEDCADKAHVRSLEQKKKQTNQKAINTLSDTIETLRDTQASNRSLIKRGESAAKMYLTTYIIWVVFTIVMAVVAVITVIGILNDNQSSQNIFPTVILSLCVSLGVPTLNILLIIGHARMTRFWDINYGEDNGWLKPILFGILNAFFMAGIWGLVRVAQTRKECKGLRDNDVKAEKLIEDFKVQLKDAENARDNMSDKA